jgi:hypothetical protein
MDDHCRLVAILGMGGIGKTILAARLTQDAAPSFERVFWRSARNAPPLDEALSRLIGLLSDQQLTAPASEAGQLALVAQLLRERPTLLVLDNLETLLKPGVRQPRYREGFEGVGALLQAFAEGRHHSCIILTSRGTRVWPLPSWPRPFWLKRSKPLFVLRSAPMVAMWQRVRSLARCGCGEWRTERWCLPRLGMPGRCGVWRSARTDSSSPAAEAMGRCGFGMCPAAAH